MGLPDIRASDAHEALALFDSMGREPFLERFGFGPARDYFVRYDGKLYDSKAIGAAAHELRHGVPVGDFRGGDAAVARLLRGLGFVVTQPFDWTRDEVVLVCELVYRNGWRTVAAETTDVKELSALLRRSGVHPPELHGPRFRNPAGIEQKAGNLKTQHPDYEGRATNGGHVDREVIAEFIADPDGMLQEAASIREALEQGNLTPPDPDLGAVGTPATEGGVRERRHLVRERDPKLRKQKIADVLKRHGRIACEACGFDFAATYGQDRGREFIECHHTTPLYVTGETKTRIEDLALLCSNCHRMIHVRPPWLTVDELRALIVNLG